MPIVAVRPIATAGSILLLGVAVNVGVAWGLSLLDDCFRSRIALADSLDHRGSWTLVLWKGYGSSAVYSTRYRAGRYGEPVSLDPPMTDICPRWMGADLFDHDAQMPAEDHRVGAGFGWPMVSLCYRVQGLRDTPPYETSFAEAIGGLDVGLSPRVLGDRTIRRLVPFRPIPLGFVANSLLYSAAIWVIFFAPGGARRVVRRRRGRCEECGFDLSHQTRQRCPECGHER